MMLRYMYDNMVNVEDIMPRPGEYLYGDMVMADAMPATAIDRLRTTDLNGVTMIVSYPKCGTTWLQEIAWLISRDGDRTEALQRSLRSRMPFLEFQATPDTPPDLDLLATTPHPIITKCHMPASIFAKHLKEDDMKIILALRNPKDALVSYYHFYIMNSKMNYVGSWDEFFELVEQKKIQHGDYFDFVKSWWAHKDNPKVLIVNYEDMKKNMEKEIRRVATFMGKDFPDDVIEKIRSHCDFASMKENKMTNYSTSPFQNHKISPFMRKGLVGDWKNFFSEEQSKFVDDKVKELAELGISMDFE